MSHYIRSGKTFKVVAEGEMDIFPELPVANYTVGQDVYGNMFLETIGAFDLPAKLYGDTTRYTNRILNTFLDRSTNTGALLVGEKGSGKTLLARSVSIEGAKQGIPTVVINQPWKGDVFNSLIQSINQPAIILFDEFEKVYDDEDQQHILTLMDGVYRSNKLFILTCNNKWKVNSHMQNRPGRIFYYLEFDGLSAEFIREYCEDNLNAKEHIDIICSMSTVFASFNFDILKALVEDMNRYNETPQEAIKILNAQPGYGGKAAFEVKLNYEGRDIPIKNIGSLNGADSITVNPFDGVSLYFEDTKKTEEGDDGYYPDISMRFDTNMLKSVSSNDGQFTFFNEAMQTTLKLKRKSDTTYSVWDAF